MIHFNRADLELVARGQQKRNKSLDSIRQYLSRMKTMSNLLNSIAGLREEALILNENNVPEKYTSSAKNILK